MIPLGVLASARVAGSSLVAPTATWDASALALSDTDPVSSWTDATGNGNHATQATSAYRPIFRTNQRNGLAVVRFTGDNVTGPHFMDTPVSASTSGVTMITVVKATSVFNGKATIIGSTSSGGWQTDMSTSDGLRMLRQYAAQMHLTGVSTIALSTWYILTARYLPGTGTALRINGTAYTSGASHTPSASRTMILGRNPGLGVAPESSSGNFFFGGDMAEIRVFTSGLSDAEVAAHEAELATKWGF